MRRQSEHELLSVMAILGSQIGQFIEGQRAEEKLRKAQADLAHVTRVATLGEMSASIAHEINQPLGAISNSASACLRWLDAQKLEEARRSVSRVIAESHRASEIIGRIRALAKKVPPRKDWLDVNETIHEVIALVQSGVQRNDIALGTQLSDDVPLILADRIQLQQVMLNLMMNAIEAMSGAGEGPRELWIRSGTDESQGVLVSVQDSGPGLDPKSLDRLFDAFYSTKPHGLGNRQRELKDGAVRGILLWPTAARRDSQHIIFITGHGDVPMTVQAMKAGAVEFLTKPFRDQELLDAIQEALERDRKAREQRVEIEELRRRVDSLTPRERDVLNLVVTGLLNKQIAGELGTSETTVKIHRHQVMEKMGANSLAELVRMSDRLGIPTPK